MNDYNIEFLRKFLENKSAEEIADGLIFPEKQTESEVWSFFVSRIASHWGYDLSKKSAYLDYRNKISSAIELPREFLLHTIYSAVYAK